MTKELEEFLSQDITSRLSYTERLCEMKFIWSITQEEINEHDSSGQWRGAAIYENSLLATAKFSFVHDHCNGKVHVFLRDDWKARVAFAISINPYEIDQLMKGKRIGVFAE